MKIRKKAILRKLGMLLALALLFTAMAVPAWADGEEGTIPEDGVTDDNSGAIPLADGDSPDDDSNTPQINPNADPMIESYYVTDANSNQPLSEIKEGQNCNIDITIVDPRITVANQNQIQTASVGVVSTDSFMSSDPVKDVSLSSGQISPDGMGISLKIELKNIVYSGNGNNLKFTLSYNGSFLPMKTVELPVTQCVPTPPAEENSNGAANTPAEGELYVTGYAVTNSAGRGDSGTELQRVEAGQKCRILVSVADTRFANFTDKEAIFDYLGLKRNADGSLAEDFANAKVTSIESFESPSLGDIYIIGESFSNGVLQYTIALNDIKYLGGSNELSLDISYTRSSMAQTTVSRNISKCVDAAETADKKDSALVLTSASYGGGSVEAGRDFTLTVDVLAPAKYAGAENVKVIITPPEQFTASSGSTMIYVGDLAPGASRQVTFELNASATAQSGSYSIRVDVSGTAASGAAPSDQMSVTVPVTQPERFEISRTDLPEYLSMGEEGYAYVSFVNKGKGAIYNVSAEITGEGITTTEGNQYIGNVQSGSESSADFTIQTSQAGTISALLTITYEDEKGNIKTLTQDFTITVEEMYMGGVEDYYPEDFGDMGTMPEENTGMPLWGWILIVLGVLAAGGGAAFFIIKKKKAKQKAAQLTEDDDEDI